MFIYDWGIFLEAEIAEEWYNLRIFPHSRMPPLSLSPNTHPISISFLLSISPSLFLFRSFCLSVCMFVCLSVSLSFTHTHTYSLSLSLSFSLTLFFSLLFFLLFPLFLFLSLSVSLPLLISSLMLIFLLSCFYRLVFSAS